MNRSNVLIGTVPMILHKHLLVHSWELQVGDLLDLMTDQRLHLLTKLGIPWDWLILMVMGMDMGKE